jgi:Asp-tRNA(Asn)/Glu-tRNA(Gln) amidotransferase B subunit
MLQKKIEPKTIAKRIAGPINAFMKEHNIAIDLLPFSPTQFEQFLKLELLDNQMKIIMDEMLSTGKDPETIIKEK